MKKIILMLLLSSILFSCNKKNNDIEVSRKLNELRKEKKEKLISELVSKYDINYMWDTLNYKFSIEYKPILESSYQLLDNFYINDIYEKDSTYFISIVSSNYISYYFTFPITKEQLNIFVSDVDEFVLVVSISEIRQIQFGLIEDSESAIVILNSTNDFIGKGKLIEIVSLK
jgi:hypothetical protein